MTEQPTGRPNFSRDELIAILAQAPMGLIISRFDGTFVYANNALAEMLGYSIEEIYNPDLIISHPDCSRPLCHRSLSQIIHRRMC